METLLHQIFPQLIAKQIEEYLYLREWKRRLKKLHQEAFTKIRIANTITMDGKIEYLVYQNPSNYVANSMLICVIDVTGMTGQKKQHGGGIKKFTDVFGRQLGPRPRKYHYSSGLDHPTAYKNDWYT